MPAETVHLCQCPNCRRSGGHPDQLLHHQMNLFLSRLDEQQRRRYVALEATRIGRGGVIRMSRITRMHVDTIRRGWEELNSELAERPLDRVRLPGGGRPPVEARSRESTGH
jgi:hypothetical protein